MQLRGLAMPRERVLRIQFCQDLHPSYLSKASLQVNIRLAQIYYTPGLLYQGTKQCHATRQV